ncbi:hypothetical protein H4582DRAFT_1967214 [Lactarius indigo]|nr:hypothetical protein H4582DRAFT_1967214 [Lactarius indigo]
MGNITHLDVAVYAFSCWVLAVVLMRYWHVVDDVLACGGVITKTSGATSYYFPVLAAGGLMGR